MVRLGLFNLKIMSLKSTLEQLADIASKRDEAHFSFIKQILLMASGLIGILVSLHKATTTAAHIRISFALALGLLSLGILCLSIALFAQVAVHKAIFLKWKEEALSHIRDEKYQPKPFVVEPSKLYALVEKIGYGSLFLSIICLTIYAVLIA